VLCWSLRYHVLVSLMTRLLFFGRLVFGCMHTQENESNGLFRAREERALPHAHIGRHWVVLAPDTKQQAFKKPLLFCVACGIKLQREINSVRTAIDYL
jgi:hypothetical protein